MLIRIILMSLSCLTVISCAANARVSLSSELTEQPLNLTRRDEKIPANITSKAGNFNSLETPDLVNKNAETSSFLSGKPVSQVSGNSINPEAKQVKNLDRKIATGITNPVTVGGYMTLTPTGQTNALNNPLYELRLYLNGQLVDSFMTVSGRAYTQSRNRHQSGTEAPLPDGRYRVATRVVPGTIPEAGDRFLPIQPLFRTRRTALGFHVDPSFNKNNGEDGTSGCIGLVSKEDLDRFLSFVRTHRPQFIDVKIQ